MQSYQQDVTLKTRNVWFNRGPRLWQLLLVEQTSLLTSLIRYSWACFSVYLMSSVLNLQSAANVATHTYEFHTQHLLLPCRWDALSHCGIINNLSAGSKNRQQRQQQQQRCTHENSHSSVSECAQLRVFENSETFRFFPKKKKIQTASKEAGGNCQEGNLCSHHGKFCKIISPNNQD